MVSVRQTVQEAIAATADIVDRGFTFVDENGREKFVSSRDLAIGVRKRAAALQASGFSGGDRVALIIPGHQPLALST